MSEHIKVICCDCKKVMKEGLNDTISHGLCAPCATKMLWLDGLDQKEITKFVKELEVTL